MNDSALIQIKDTTANPAPLGLLAFGTTTVLLNLHNAGCYEMNSMILAMGLCYGGSAQVIAGIMEWKKGNTFATTAFISYGFFWLSLVALVLLPKIIPTVTAADEKAMAAYLATWGLFTAVMFVGTFHLNRALHLYLGRWPFCFSAGHRRLHRCQLRVQARHGLRGNRLRSGRNLYRPGASAERTGRKNCASVGDDEKIIAPRPGAGGIWSMRNLFQIRLTRGTKMPLWS